jgi:hypothetical protein
MKVGDALARFREDVSSVVGIQGQVRATQLPTCDGASSAQLQSLGPDAFELDVVVLSAGDCFSVIKQIGRRFPILACSYDDSNRGHWAKTNTESKSLGYCSFVVTLLAFTHIFEVRVRTRAI